jgi:hypothetical protein
MCGALLGIAIMFAFGKRTDGTDVSLKGEPLRSPECSLPL